MLTVKRAGFIMAETTISLAILTVAIIFWGQTEIMMQQHERQAVSRVHRERHQYEQAQLQLPAVKKRLHDD